MIKLSVDLLIAGADWVSPLPPSYHQSPKPEWHNHDHDDEEDDIDHDDHDNHDHHDSEALFDHSKHVQSFSLSSTLTSGEHQ